MMHIWKLIQLGVLILHFKVYALNNNQVLLPWRRRYQCDGRRQSPININTSTVIMRRPFNIQFIIRNVYIKGLFMNNGMYPVFMAEEGYKLRGVPHHENDLFQLHGWHIHFGRSDFEGSEHTVDGKKYSGEIHMVHFNTKYRSYEESLKHPDGRAVVSIFIEGGQNCNRPYIDAFLAKNLQLLHENAAVIPTEIAATDLLPDSSDIYTYSGSATTPPCGQNVQWIIYKQPIVLSTTTLQLARRLLNVQGFPQGMVGNFRRTQNRNGRLIEANFVPL